LNLKAKLGLDVFKESPLFPIEIRPGKEDDPRLFYAVRFCPAVTIQRSSPDRYTHFASCAAAWMPASIPSITGS